MAYIHENMNGATSTPTKYNGPHFCPKCGYNGIFAVHLAMDLKATHDGKSDEYRKSGSGDSVLVHEPALLSLKGAKGSETARRRGRALIEDDERARIIQMGTDGKTATEISVAIGRPKASIYTVLHRARTETAIGQQEETKPRSRKGGKLPPRRHNKTCPECKQGGFTPQGLGAHRWIQHGVEGARRKNPALNTNLATT